MDQSFSIRTACPNCGVQNRIPARHLSDRGRCGSCKSPLAPLSHPIDADARTFDAILREAAVPVFVDFWASWCGPCRMAAPEVKKLAAEMAGHAIVLKVDTEANPELSDRYGIRSIPNFMVFRHGRAVLQRAGVAPAAEMRRWVEQSAAA